jgi:hypothetical protein
LSTNKQILIKSLQLSLILTIVNVALSIVLSKVFSVGIELGQITGFFGNFTLLEVMTLFLYGGAVDFTSSVKWSSALRLLRIPIKAKEEGKKLDTSLGGQSKLNKESEREWETEKSRSGERRAIVYILSGVILLAEIVALAVLSG